MSAKGYAGYWTDYSYRGRMPDGKWQMFATPEEYFEAYDEKKLEMELSKVS